MYLHSLNDTQITIVLPTHNKYGLYSVPEDAVYLNIRVYNVCLYTNSHTRIANEYDQGVRLPLKRTAHICICIAVVRTLGGNCVNRIL